MSDSSLSTRICARPLSITETLTVSTIGLPSTESKFTIPASFRRSSETMAVRDESSANTVPAASWEKSLVLIAAAGSACAFVEMTVSPSRAFTLTAS